MVMQLSSRTGHVGEAAGFDETQVGGRDGLAQLETAALAFFGPFLFGNVLGDLDEVCDGAVAILDGGDGGAFPVQRAVPAAVEKFPLPLNAGKQGFPQGPVKIGRHPARLEETGRLAYDLIAAKPGYLAEAGVRIFDYAVGVGDDKLARALFGGPIELFQFRFCVQPVVPVTGGICAHVPRVSFFPRLGAFPIFSSLIFSIQLIGFQVTSNHGIYPADAACPEPVADCCSGRPCAMTHLAGDAMRNHDQYLVKG